MKKSIMLLPAMLLLLGLSACASDTPTESLTETENNSVTEMEEENSTTESFTASEEEEAMKQSQFYIIAGDSAFTVDFAENSSTDALRELLKYGDLTIDMSDYGSFEKVGSIGQSLPCEDTQISTVVGDVMLYQGNQIVIFYGSNSWSYSRLGKINDVTKDDLLAAFGSGDVTVTVSLMKP